MTMHCDEILAKDFYERSYELDDVTLPKYKIGSNEPLYDSRHQFMVTSWKKQDRYDVASEFTCRHCLLVVEKGQIPEGDCK